MSYIKEIEKENITSFLLKKYPIVSTAILSGSVIDETADLESDIDIILIVFDRNQLYNETLLFEKFKLQTFIIPLQHLYERLYADYFSGRGHFIGLLAKGVHFFGNQQLTDSILIHSRELKNKGPKQMSDEDHVRKRIYISKCINKLGNEKEEWENLILDAGKLVDELIGFKLHSEGVWRGDGKHRMKFLEKHNPSFKQQMIGAISFAYRKRDYKKLIAITKNELNKKGGLIELYPSDNIQLTASGDHFCIHIKFLDNVEQQQKTLFALNQSFLELRDNSNNDFTYYFYTAYLTGRGFSSDDIFCVIHANNEWLNSFLIDWLFTLKNDHNLNDIIFPAFIGFKFKFVTEQLYIEVLPIFNKLSFSVVKNLEEFSNEGFKIFSALTILKNFSNTYFNNREISISLKDFMFFMLKSYFIYSYDNNEQINSKELIKRRNDTLLQFEETYYLQKDILEELWIEGSDSVIISEIRNLVYALPNLSSELDNFPDYNLYLLGEIRDSSFKELVFLKEFLMRCMEILLIEASSISYIFYSVLRLENVSFKLIQQEMQLN